MALPLPRPGADLAVHRARATGWRGTRGEVARWLEAVPVESLGLGPEELLYLPRLRVQVPAHQGSAPGRMPDRIAAELRALLAGADSGWGSGLSPGRAYRFTSRSRYFAWLVALRVKHGSPPALAAFHTATGETSLRQWQRTTVLQDGAAFVATIARLAEIGCAARWIERFEPADITLVRRALEQRFAIRLGSVAPPPMRRAATEAPGSPITTASPPPLLAEAITRLEASGNHWHTLPSSGKALLLAAVMLARAPSQSRAQMAAHGAAIVRFSSSVEIRSGDPPSALPQPRPAGRKGYGAARPFPLAGAAPQPTPARPTEHRARRPALLPSAVPSAAYAGNASATGKPAIETGQAPVGRALDALDRSASASPVAASASRTPAPSAHSVSMPFIPLDARFETGFGGLLFLLNAFIALGLYPDFTQPLGARLDPSPLWLADRIGRYWFGARYRRDPLALWIAAHAASGRLPHAWRAEPDWLTGFATSPPRRVVRHGRATLWHLAGFPLLDEEEGRAPRRPVPALRQRVSRIAPARLPSKPSDRWAACLALYLDARLNRLCGAGLSMLALPARIATRDLDLSARFALDHYPIQLRIAGLDRDPGWQPAEGRAIAFLFE